MTSQEWRNEIDKVEKESAYSRSDFLEAVYKREVELYLLINSIEGRRYGYS